MSDERKWTVADIPDLTGRVAVVTGANTGLGLETVRALSGAGCTVVVAVRNLDKGERARASIAASNPAAKLSLQHLDVASLDSIRSAAADIAERHDRLDMLINNAGVMYTEWQTTGDGFELQMGVNHLGPFALTMLLLDLLVETAGSRVVAVSSVGHKFRSRLDPTTMMSGDGYDRVAAYGRSKLANLLFTYELERRLTANDTSTSALAAHPGVASTELSRNAPTTVKLMERLSTPFVQSAEMGALPILRAATDPAAVGGQYYGPSGFMEFRGAPVVVESTARSHDTDLQQRLWAESERLTGITSPI